MDTRESNIIRSKNEFLHRAQKKDPSHTAHLEAPPQKFCCVLWPIPMWKHPIFKFYSTSSGLWALDPVGNIRFLQIFTRVTIPTLVTVISLNYFWVCSYVVSIKHLQANFFASTIQSDLESFWTLVPNQTQSFVRANTPNHIPALTKHTTTMTGAPQHALNHASSLWTTRVQ